MNNLSKEEYLKLIEQFLDNQYDQPSEEEDIIPDYSWIPSEPPAKEIMKLSSINGVIDVTKFKKEKIEDALYKCVNIKVNNFLIKIKSYGGYPLPIKQSKLTMSISVWEERTKTPTGNPCRMTYPMNFSKDNRFDNCPQLSYFNNGSSAIDMPVEEIINLIRWIQVVTKFTCFL